MKTKQMCWGMAAVFAATLAVAQVPDTYIDKYEIKAAAKAAATIDKDEIKYAVKRATTTVAAYATEIAIAKSMALVPGEIMVYAQDDARAAQRMAERQQEMAERASERARDLIARKRDEASRDDDSYNRGTELLDQSRWDRAAAEFDQVAKKNGPRADGALYWKAWALYKQGTRDGSLESLKALATTYPNSRWLNDAKALELEVKQSTGQTVSPGANDDEEIKLLALQGLLRTNPESALPVLDKLLKGSASPRLKARALFVLSAQGNSDKAREMLTQIAKGGSNPDLQLRAIVYLGQHPGNESHQTLAGIYNSTSDVTVKRRILQAFMQSGDKEHLAGVAKSDSSADLRMEAVRYLSSMNARDEVWQLYASESSPDVKRQIISSLYSDGFSPKVAEIARSEKDPALRKSAIRVLTHFGKSGDLLAGLYDGEKDEQCKREIVNGLSSKGEAKALVDIARKETNPELKKEIVSRLSTMKSKEATDYMMELLK